MDRIYLRQKDGTLRPLELQPYDSEDLLQTLLVHYPDLLAGDQLSYGEPRRWLFISREHGVPGGEGEGARWSLDHLFLDQDGIPTLVEVKRASDTRIRREVVGQMLDYAANAIAYWPVDSIRATFEARCEVEGLDPADRCRDALGLESDEEQVVEKFWHGVRTNLQAGRVRLLFIADAIPQELARIVEFLNEQMDPAEVLAVELKQFRDGEDDIGTFVPRVVGRTAAASTRKGLTRPAETWTEERFFEALLRQTDERQVEAARSILRWIEPKVSRIHWGRGKEWGSFTPILQLKDADGIRKMHFFAVWTYGSAEIQFEYLKSREPFRDPAMREELRKRLNRVPGVEIAMDALEKRPGIPLAALVSQGAMSAFCEAMDWSLRVTTDGTPGESRE